MCECVSARARARARVYVRACTCARVYMCVCVRARPDIRGCLEFVPVVISVRLLTSACVVVHRSVYRGTGDGELPRALRRHGQAEPGVVQRVRGVLRGPESVHREGRTLHQHPAELVEQLVTLSLLNGSGTNVLAASATAASSSLTPPG